MSYVYIISAIVGFLIILDVARWIIGGWSTLRKYYAVSGKMKGKDYMSSTVKVFRWPYFFPGKYGLTPVSLSKEGIWIHPYISIVSRDIRIPWECVTKASNRINGSEISVKNFSGVIEFIGYPSEEILKKCGSK